MRSDARPPSVTVTAAVVSFAVLVVLPYAVNEFAPAQAWTSCGSLAVRWRWSSPLAAGLAGFASWLALWRRGDLDEATRRLHLVVLVAVVASAVFLVSHAGQSAIRWWQG